MEGWEGHRSMKTFQFVKLELRVWKKVAFGNIKYRKNNILRDMFSIDSCKQEGNLILSFLF